MRNYPEFVRAIQAALVWCGTLRVDTEAPTGHASLQAADGRQFSFKEPLSGIWDALTTYDSEIISEPDDKTALSGQRRLFAIHVREAVDTSVADGLVLVFTEWGVETE